jgi:hypothetical protein
MDSTLVEVFGIRPKNGYLESFMKSCFYNLSLSSQFNGQVKPSNISLCPRSMTPLSLLCIDF